MPSDTDRSTVRFVHTISEAGRLLPSASRWNSIEIDFNLVPQSATAYDSLPSRFSKSFEYDLIITDRTYFKRFIYISVSIALAIVLLVLLIHFLPRKHAHHASSQNLTLAVNQALTFFDAQKCNYIYIYFATLCISLNTYIRSYIFLENNCDVLNFSWKVPKQQSGEISRRFRNERRGLN